MNEIKRYASDNVCKMLVGNKIDLVDGSNGAVDPDEVVSTRKCPSLSPSCLLPPLPSRLPPLSALPLPLGTPWSLPIPSCGPRRPASFVEILGAETGQALAAELGIPFLETSAKQSRNVEEAFMRMAAELKKRAANTDASQPNIYTGEPFSLGSAELL